MNVIVVGPGGEIAPALDTQDATIESIDGVATRDKLEDAGAESADVMVITDVEEATVVPVARTLNPDVRLVVYARESVPDFVRGQLDLAIDPDLMDPSVVAEELARN
jgi:hypothetical protein